MFAQQFVALGYQQIPAATLASATPLEVPAGANFAVIQAEAAAVRWRDDKTAPTATVGMILSNTGNNLEYSGTLANLEFIAETGSPILNVSYYRIAG
jgi:hypothetical protein